MNLLVSIHEQIAWLFILAIPVACISWTVTHEKIFEEPRKYCERRCQAGKTLVERKVFYIFTCEYCFSHYVVIIFLLFTQFKMLFGDWIGYVISGFSLVWVANVYISIFSLLRTGLKKERTEIQNLEREGDGLPAK